MRILVTGANGFVGQHVLNELEAHGHTPFIVDKDPPLSRPGATCFTCDLRNPDALATVVHDVQPDGCIHLAGIAFVPVGWSDPHLVFSVNLGGTINLLEAFRQGSPKTRILVVTSSEVYGRKPSSEPLPEEAPMAPSNVYAVSKVAADLSTLLYHRRYGLHVMTARPHNHIGPGQSDQFVTSAFANQLARLKASREDPVIRVGNLECRRDFTDVRDVARAYRLIVEKGQPHEAYNVASGRLVRIREVLDLLCRLAGIQPRLEVDPERYRTKDEPPTLDTNKILRHVGWKPEIHLADTLADIYQDITQEEARP